MKYTELPKDILGEFQKGVIIPALPLALNRDRKMDERRQRALMRYYLDVGVGGVVVAVHTTQFEMHLPKVDLLSEYRIPDGAKLHTKRIVGGLLGHWAVWNRSAVKLLDKIKNGEFEHNVKEVLVLANQVTDSNAAFFDAANNFSGCIVGLHEVLRRQGLLEGLWTLDKNEVLSPGQLEEIDRVYAAYPELNDDEFVAENRDRWLS